MPLRSLLLLAAAACSMSSAKPSYTVQWPDDWVTTDLTDNPTVKSHYRHLLSYEGGRPKGQTVLFQHAIVVSSSSTADVAADIKKRQLQGANAVFTSESIGTVGAHGSIKLEFHNRVDPLNRTTYHIVDDGKRRYILHLHAPSINEDLNAAADLIASTFAL